MPFVHSCLPPARRPEKCEISFEVIGLKTLNERNFITRRKIAFTPEITEGVIDGDVVIKCGRHASAVGYWRRQ